MAPATSASGVHGLLAPYVQGERPVSEIGLLCLAAASPISVTFTEVAFGVAVTGALVDWWRRRIEPFPTSLAPALAAFAIASVVSAITSVEPLRSLFDLRNLAFWGIFLIAPWGVAAGADLRRIQNVWLAAAALAAAHAVLQAATGLDLLRGSSDDATGFFSGRLEFGHYQASACLLALALLRDAPDRPQQVRFGALVLLFGLGVALSAGRGAWLSLASVSVLLFARRARRRILVVLAVVLALQITLVELRSGGVREWARSFVAVAPADATVVETDTLYSNLWRLTMWREGLRLFAARPVTGTGVDTMGDLTREFLTPFADFGVAHLHSNYFELLATRGFPGLWAFLLLSFSALSGLRRRQATVAGREQAAVVAAMGATLLHLVHGLTYFSVGNGILQVGYQLVLGLGFGAIGRGDGDDLAELFRMVAATSLAIAAALFLSPWVDGRVALGLALTALVHALVVFSRGQLDQRIAAPTAAFAMIVVAAAALLVPLERGLDAAWVVVTAAAVPYAAFHVAASWLCRSASPARLNPGA